MKKTLPRYQEWNSPSTHLELHRRHVMWELTELALTDEECNALYNFLVDEAIEEFKERTGQDILLLGSSNPSRLRGGHP